MYFRVAQNNVNNIKESTIMKITKSIKSVMTITFFGIGMISAQPIPTVYDTYNGIEDDTDGGVRVTLYTNGSNQATLRSAFAFQRATITLALPIDHVFYGLGQVFTTPPSLSLGYRLMDYRDDLLQLFGGFSTRAMGSYDLNLHLLLKPHPNLALLATAGSANEIVERIESDSLTVYKISTNPDIGLAARIRGKGIPALNDWFLTGLWANDSFSITGFHPRRRSFVSVGRLYDERLTFEFRAFHDGKRQLIITYKFN